MKNKINKLTRACITSLIFISLISQQNLFALAQESEDLSTEASAKEETPTATSTEESQTPETETEEVIEEAPDLSAEATSTEQEDLAQEEPEEITEEIIETEKVIELEETPTSTSTEESQAPEIEPEKITEEIIEPKIEEVIEEPTSKFIGTETKFFINQDDENVNTRVATLTFVNQGRSSTMLISNYADFKDTKIEKYKEEKKWILSPEDGLKTVYVKFYDRQDNEFATEKDYIELITTQENIMQSKGDFDKNNKTNRLDYNILQLNLGRTGENTADTNNDGLVDIYDVFNLMINWNNN